MKASIAGRCTYRASQNAFWEYHDWIYQNQKDITHGGTHHFTISIEHQSFSDAVTDWEKQRYFERI